MLVTLVHLFLCLVSHRICDLPFPKLDGARRRLALRFIMNCRIILAVFPSRSLDHPLNPIETLLERLHFRTIAEPHEVVARTVEQVATLGGVQVKEYAWHDDGLLLKQGVEEGEAVADVNG